MTYIISMEVNDLSHSTFHKHLCLLIVYSNSCHRSHPLLVVAPVHTLGATLSA